MRPVIITLALALVLTACTTGPPNVVDPANVADSPDADVLASSRSDWQVQANLSAPKAKNTTFQRCVTDLARQGTTQAALFTAWQSSQFCRKARTLLKRSIRRRSVPTSPGSQSPPQPTVR